MADKFRCCCDTFVLWAPPNIEMECLYQHDYFTNQWEEEYTGFAARLDACSFDDDDAINVCECECSEDDILYDDDVGPGFQDLYNLRGGSENYNFGCGNEVTITRFFFACGGFVSQTITVSDTVAPDLFIPADKTQECVSNDGVAGPDAGVFDELDNFFGSARAMDLCTNPTITQTTGSFSTNPCNYSFQRRFQASDGCNLSPAGAGNFIAQQVAFVDTTPPVLKSLQNSPVDPYMTFTCDQTALFTAANTAPTASDACDNFAGSLVSSDLRYDGKCTGDYSIERTWTATDTCGNAAYMTQIIVVEDPDAPVVTTGGNLAVDTYEEVFCLVPPPNTYTVVDACGGVTSLFMDETTSGFIENTNRYDVIRTYKAADDCGNSYQWQEVYRVDLGSIFTFSSYSPVIPTSKGVNTDIDFVVAGFICSQIYVIFDLGPAEFVSVTTFYGTVDCTDENGGLLYCAFDPNFLIYPVSGDLFSFTVNVPTSYLPDTLQIKYSLQVADPRTLVLTDPFDYVILQFS